MSRCGSGLKILLIVLLLVWMEEWLSGEWTAVLILEQRIERRALGGK